MGPLAQLAEEDNKDTTDHPHHHHSKAKIFQTRNMLLQHFDLQPQFWNGVKLCKNKK